MRYVTIYSTNTVKMRLFTKIARCVKLTNFYRELVHDVKLSQHQNKVISLKIIGSGSVGESPSVCLSTSNNEKYLFNCGEDCQRLLTDQDEQISRIKHIFITQTKWNCIGGILYICRNVNNTQGWLPKLHGPKQLYKCIKRILCLSTLSELDFKPIDCNWTNFFENDALRIDFLSIKPNESRSGSRSNEVLVFVGKSKIHSSKAMAQFMILDLPTKEHLMSFLESPQFKAIITNFDIIVHFSPKNVVNHRDYQKLLSKLHSKKHVYLNESNEFSRLKSVYKLQKKLNGIDEQVHPPLNMPLDVSNKLLDLDRLKSDDVSTLRDLTNFYSTYYFNGIDSKNTQDKMNDQQMKNPQFDQSLDIERLKTFPKVVFLGTVSAIASLQRNNTSILVHATRNESILLDCGEGTFGQIVRLYGKRVENVIQNIKAVFISHLHYDHFGGLVELLRMRKKYLPPDRTPLLLLSPKNDLKSWLFFYDNNIEAIHDDLFFIDNDSLMAGGLSVGLCRTLGIHKLQTCRVPHYNISHAITLSINESKPFKLTFSSDTIPCDELVHLGRNSTLLIHEATYPDELIRKATENRHCTVSQAIKQSQEMNAKYTILTHFSRRYKLPIIDNDKHKNIGIAFDFMELTENDLPKISSLNPKYHKLFSNSE